MKKLASLSLAFVILLGFIFAVPTTVYADDTVDAQNYHFSGDFQYSILSDNTAQITDYHGFNEKVVIPSTVDGYTVTSIGNRAFSYEPWPEPVALGLAQTGVSRFAQITEVTIPDTVISIEYGAFSSCKNLVGIIIPDSVQSIGAMAFAYCKSLSYLVVGSSLESIATNAFASCKGLQLVYVDENNLVYDSRDNCNAIIETATNTLVVGCKDTVIPQSVTSIGDYAFYYNDLDSVKISSSVTSIGKHAFAGNKNLSSVFISGSVKSIGNSAFFACEELKYLTMGNSVESIGDYAFSKCISLSNVVISYSVKSIGENAFAHCDNLREVILCDQLKSIGNHAFFCCPSIDEITIPKYVTSIDDRAFGYVYDDKEGKYILDDDFIIYGYHNTQAQQYASENNIKFVSLGYVPTFVLGDVDGDNEISALDATAVMQHTAQILTIDDSRFACADVDKDQEISVLDATLIQKYVAKQIDSF